MDREKVASVNESVSDLILKGYALALDPQLLPLLGVPIERNAASYLEEAVSLVEGGTVDLDPALEYRLRLGMALSLDRDGKTDQAKAWAMKAAGMMEDDGSAKVLYKRLRLKYFFEKVAEGLGETDRSFEYKDMRGV